MIATEASSSAPRAAASDFRRDVLHGLASLPRVLPGKYLWDERGSRLFEEVTRSAGYYPTSAETALLAGCVGEIATMVGSNATIVEFGSGATHKVALLLDALEAPRRYVGVDISSDFTAAAASRLRAAYPSVNVEFVEADFSREMAPLRLDEARSVIGVLLGCAIGNMGPEDAVALLARIRSTGVGFVLVGQDATQDASRLRAAYGNPAMAAFHENILTRMRSELGASLAPQLFRHEISVLDAPRRVEAHLVAAEPTEIAIDDLVWSFQAGETIRTDVSCKYAPEVFAELAAAAGWTPLRRWLDPEHSYCLHLLRSP